MKASVSLALMELGRRFGEVEAVRRVSFRAAHGEMIAIIGPSGAGKSTLMRLINRLVEPTEGRILAGDRDVTALTGRTLCAWRAECAMVFQQFNLSPRLNALTNVLMGSLQRHRSWRTLTGLFPHEERLRAMTLLDEFGLAHKAFVRAERLSGGQQQRVALARALMQRPSIMLADEPTASLDPRNAAQVMAALRTINRDRGLTVICNLHNVGHAREYCDRIIGLRQGAIVFDGPPAALTDAAARDLYGAEQDEADITQATPELQTA
ncbi:phosphonate ABC transporter ATP-binding protein [Elioraea sp.]|uniref:phosphonate ABC transporter ATP-binding protein n=1 Tax=Elioraea sp. TaxID=2185103 RepID=UPI0025BDB978|nr:phosphonate ABC transporter ATP-binding protein [Elioraea sp.]